MTDQLQELRDRIRESQAEALSRWRPLSGVTYSIRETYKTLEANLTKALQAAASAQYRVEVLRDDDLMNPAGRERLIREAIEKGKSEVRKYQSTADAAVLIIKAQLQEAALPRVDPAREAMVRQELMMRVEAIRSRGRDVRPCPGPRQRARGLCGQLLRRELVARQGHLQGS